LEREDGRDAKLVDAALRTFGLRFTEDVVKIPSMRRFLKPAAAIEPTSQEQSARNTNTMNYIRDDLEVIESTQSRIDVDEVVEELGSWGYPMTVDYSRYLTNLSGYDWKINLIPLNTVLRLRKIPTEIDNSWPYHPDDVNDIIPAEEDNGQGLSDTINETTVDVTLTVAMTVSSSVGPAEESGDDDGDDDAEHSLEQQSEDSYQWSLAHAVESMLLHYNFDCITSFTFHMVKATSYLALAPKMAKLQRLRLDREKTMPDTHINNTVLFIQRNQAAFPWKPRLDLEFLYEWHIFDDEERDEDDGENPHYFAALDLSVVEGRQLSRTRKLRERFFHYMKYLITLYEAVGRPRAIFVGKLPLFYEHSQGIDLDGLLDFDDWMMDRIDHGEGPAMEAFFRRCKSLRELKLRVDSHTLFSWAAAAAMHATGSNPSTLGILAPKPCTSTTSSISSTSLIHGYPHQSSSTGILKHLQTLKLYTQNPYRFAIHALNDAMVAFADSLRHVKLECVHPYQNPQITTAAEAALYRNPALMRRARRSLRLYTVPWANTIGDWPRPLPQLQSLTIHLSRIGSVDIGSLDQCSNLRELEIRYGDVKQCELRPGDIDVVIGTDQEETELPSDIESVRQLMDTRYQQADFNFALFPKWNLPKLRILVLVNLPALRFDFASLETMPNLVELRLKVDKTWGDERFLIDLQTVHDFRSLQSAAWEQKRAQYERFVFKRWTHPALKTLTIEGAPATMFYLDWLKGCPSLERLTLKFEGPCHYLRQRPFFLGSETEQESINHIDSYHGHDGGTEKDKSINRDGDNEDLNGEDKHDNTPFWSSKLIELELRGPWIMSEEDLFKLLTIYAPFLKTFHVDRLTDNTSLSGYTFLEAFRRADEIHAKYAIARRELEEMDKCSGNMGGNPDKFKDVRIPGQALTSVEANYSISKRDRRDRPPLGLVLIKRWEISEFQDRGFRVYKLNNQVLVLRADRDCFDLEMGEDARKRYD
ncbi:hypothetical protein BGZ99_004404, partial [Dissophora globulifera]